MVLSIYSVGPQLKACDLEVNDGFHGYLFTLTTDDELFVLRAFRELADVFPGPFEFHYREGNIQKAPI